MGPAAFSGMAGKLDCLCGRASAFLFFFLSELGAGVAILPPRSASDFLGRQLMTVSFAQFQRNQWLTKPQITKHQTQRTRDGKTKLRFFL